MRKLSSCANVCHSRGVEQEGHVPDVGKIEGVLSLDSLSVVRK
jgi:hypothetical protein